MLDCWNKSVVLQSVGTYTVVWILYSSTRVLYTLPAANFQLLINSRQTGQLNHATYRVQSTECMHIHNTTIIDHGRYTTLILLQLQLQLQLLLLLLILDPVEPAAGVLGDICVSALARDSHSRLAPDACSAIED